MGCTCTKPNEEDSNKEPDKTKKISVTKKELGSNKMNEQPPTYNPPFPTEMVGTFSNHGIEPSRHYSANEDAVVKINQDRGSVDYPFIDSYNSALFCVMDGHGQQGDKVSEFCIQDLHEHLHDHKSEVLADPIHAFTKAYDTVDARLANDKSVNSRNSGTSAVAVYLNGSTLITTCSGDSRAVIASKSANGKLTASDLSIDQNPDSPGECDRIIAAGGFITEPEEPGLSARVWTKDRTIGLSMARSLGDHELARYGVIATPVVTTHSLKPNDSVMILASDGIWEFITSQEAMDIVQKHPEDATAACKDLIIEATQRWRDEEGPYRDDITAIVIYLDQLRPYMDAQAKAPEKRIRANTSCTPADFEQQLTEPVPGNSSLPEAGPSSTAAVEPSPKDKNFRRRRLSVDDEAIQGDAAKAMAAVAAASNTTGASPDSPASIIPAGGGASPAQGPKKDRRRRPSISPDMDPTGKKIEPLGK